MRSVAKDTDVNDLGSCLAGLSRSLRHASLCFRTKEELSTQERFDLTRSLLDHEREIRGARGGTMTNKLYYGDNLAVLRASIAAESVDLVYLDPPFNSNASYNVLFKAPGGDAVPGADRGVRRHLALERIRPNAPSTRW